MPVEVMKQFVEVHFPGIKQQLLSTALTQFYEIRDQAGLKKKPSTSEVLDWLNNFGEGDYAPFIDPDRTPGDCPMMELRYAPPHKSAPPAENAVGGTVWLWPDHENDAMLVWVSLTDGVGGGSHGGWGGGGGAAAPAGAAPGRPHPGGQRRAAGAAGVPV